MGEDSIGPGLAAYLVPWLRSWRTGLTSLDDVVAAVTADRMEGIEQVVLGPDDPIGKSLAAGLARFSTTSPDEIRLVQPVPGDVRGLPVSGPFSAAALAAGEAVTTQDFGLVPQVQTHTSGSGDTWQTVAWRYFDLPTPPVPADFLTVGEADMALSEALRGATAALTALDVARWDPELGRALTRMRAPQGRQLPPGFDGRSRRLYDRASLLERALRVAETDALGGAVTAYEAASRREALRPLATACRQAIGAACHARLG